MTGISHKLAQRYLRMALDGLLSPTQHADLETHLRDCEACRRDSESLASLTTRLHTEFQSRWDDHDGPSKQVLTNIQSQTRRIMMQKRVDFMFNLLGSVAALLILFFVVSSVVAQLQKRSAASNGNQTATPAPLSQGKLIAFVSKQTGNNDIYTMNSDGSHVINLTDNPADDNFPVWSPDGTRIAFVSDRDGNQNIYVMNLDGSNLTRIADDTGQDTNPLWSPDGAKIAYASGDFSKNNTNIYIVDADGQNKKRLTNYVPNTTVSPERWSPDGQFILFGVNRQIVQVNVQDGSLTPLTPQVADGMFTPTNLVLSADGSTLTYLTECDQRERGNSGFCKKVQSIQRYTTQVTTAQDALRIQNICELKGPSQTLAYYSQTKWSPDRTKIIFAFSCEEHGGLFYIANADGSDFKRLINDPILNKTVNFDWSYDSQSIVLTSTLDNPNQDGLSTLNINDALANSNIRPTPLNTPTTQVSSLTWQPVPNYEAVIPPTLEPDKTLVNDMLIAFTSEKDGNAEIYTMKSNGSDLKNLTNNPLAKDVNPVWSPDGKHIAYESELNGFMQIYLMNADGTHATQLTSDQANHAIGGHADSSSSLWSPDGKEIITSQQSNDNQDNWALYLLNIATGQKTQLFNQPAKYWDTAWSPDGKHISFIPMNPQISEASHIYVVDADGGNLSELTKTLPSDQTWSDYPGYYWSQDGQSIIFITSNANYVAQNGLGGDNNNIYKWQVYQAKLDGTLLLKASTHSPIGGWWQGTYFIMPLTGNSAWNWIGSDGKIINTVNPMQSCQNSSGLGQPYKQSLHGNVAIGAGCTNGDWWVFTANASGTTFVPLLNSPIHAPDGGMEFSWSGDDKFLALTMTTPKNTDMYILNVAESQKDPSIQPIKVSIGGGQLFYTGAWQPIANHDVVQVNPTHEPTPTFRFGEPVETKEQALIAAHAPMNGNFNYVGTPVVVKVQKGSPEEFSSWAGSTIPSPKQIWVVVYYNEAWQSTFIAPSKFAYNENGAVVTLPPDMLTPPAPFRGCVIVVIDASNGHTVSVASLTQGVTIPECGQ